MKKHSKCRKRHPAESPPSQVLADGEIFKIMTGMGQMLPILFISNGFWIVIVLTWHIQNTQVVWLSDNLPDKPEQRRQRQWRHTSTTEITLRQVYEQKNLLDNTKQLLVVQKQFTIFNTHISLIPLLCLQTQRDQTRKPGLAPRADGVKAG